MSWVWIFLGIELVGLVVFVWIIRWLGKELAARTYSMGFGKANTYNSTPSSDWNPSQWQDFGPWLWLCKLLPFTTYIIGEAWIEFGASGSLLDGTTALLQLGVYEHMNIAYMIHFFFTGTSLGILESNCEFWMKYRFGRFFY